MEQPSVNPNKPFLVGVLILAFLAGGLAGGFVAGLAGTGEKGQPTAGSRQPVASSQTLSVEEDSATVDVIEKVSPAVVSIIASKDFSKVFTERRQSPLDEFFGFPFGLPFEQPQPEGKQDIGWGTGFIVKSDGTIVTNKHVVEVPGADEYKVVLNDERNFTASIVAKDPSRDVAILKIDATSLPTVELGDSSQLQVGQTVIAIGNALGEFRNTATKGVISGLSRTITASDAAGQSEVIEEAIQTDAAINRGNSGGPLLNLAGQAIGVNTAVSGQGQNIGFAIPVSVIKDDLESVEKVGKIVRPFLGICYTLITKELAQESNLPVDYGALIQRGSQCPVAVVPGSPADKAGLTENDILLEFDGQRIDEDHTLASLINRKKVGDQVTLKVYHKGQEKTVTVTLEERKE